MAFEKKRLWKWKPNNKQRGVKKTVWSTRWYAKGDKLRYDITTPPQKETGFDKKSLVKPGSIRAVAYPDKRVCYNVGSGEVVIDKHLRPAGNPYGLSRCFDIKRLYQTNAKFDLPSLLSRWKKTVQPEIKEDYIGQIRCVKIVFDWEKIESEGKNRKRRFEVWVAPELSYSLIKTQFLTNTGMMGSPELRLVEGYEAAYEKLEKYENIWLLKEVVILYNRIPNFGSWALSDGEKLTVKFSDVKIGIDTPDEIFTLEGLGVPKDTKLLDKIK